MARGQLDLFSMLVGGFVGHRLSRKKAEVQDSGITGEMPVGVIFMAVVLCGIVMGVIFFVALWLFGATGATVAWYGILTLVFVGFVWFMFIQPRITRRKRPPQGSGGIKYTYVPSEKKEDE